MGASGSSQSSNSTNMTPQSFQNLQQPFANQIGNLLQGTNNAQTTQNLTQGYQGPLTTPIGGNEQQTLGQLQNMTNGMNTGSATNTGQNAALASQVGSGGANAGAYAQNVMNQNQNPQTSANQYMQNLQGADQTGAFNAGAAGANNPISNAYVQAAQRQTQQALQESLSQSLPSQFAAAGQNVAPGTSSAFDRAAAIATRGSADALGDIATNINYNNMNNAQTRSATALGQNSAQNAAAGLQTQNLGVNTQQNAQQNAQTAAQLQQAGATANSGIQAQDVNTAINNLQAQALPRLISDQGIQNGMSAFNNNVNSILAGLGIGAGVTRPVIGNSSSGSSAGINLK
jgi:hypothetical protein